MILFFFYGIPDSFSDEEDEFMMADDDEDVGNDDEGNGGLGGQGNELGQGDMQNLHIDGKLFMLDCTSCAIDLFIVNFVLCSQMKRDLLMLKNKTLASITLLMAFNLMLRLLYSEIPIKLL